MDIGTRINRLLSENQMEQKDLAEALNYTQATMSRWLKGTRTPRSEALCAIADYFDVSVDWLLGRSEYRNYNGFISGDDALEYCEKAKESALKCWYKVANFDVTEISATSLANNTQACAHFEREILRWEYDIPRMIHSLADGTWKEAGRKTEPKQEWIPCSERLPSDGQYVIIQYYDTTGKNHVSVVGACYNARQGFVDTGYGEMWFGNGNDDVIAWLPLPEQFKKCLKGRKSVADSI